MQLLLLTFLAFLNGKLAKRKEQKVGAWVLYTVLAYLVGMIIGMFVVILNFSRNAIDINLFSSPDPKVREMVSQQVMQMLANDPLQELTVVALGVGGYLLVRYLLERKPEKKKPEVHWMDKIGQDQ